MRRARVLVLAAVLCLAGARILMGAPEEIQVYLDDTRKPGESGVEMHVNDVFSGRSMPNYAGEEPPLHQFRFTPEFSWGLSRVTDWGLYLLTTTVPGGSPQFDGAKLRFKWIPPHDEHAGRFWGMNFELGCVASRVSQSMWASELKGIVGLRRGAWLVAGNLNLDWDMSGPTASGTPDTEVDVKVSRDIGHNLSAGLEHYAELGPLNDLGHLSDLSQVLYGVTDLSRKGWDLNFGVGRGLTPSSDQWVVKAIVGIDFGRR